MAEKIKLHSGDSAEVLKQYPDNHFDSIVTDPPYGIEFLGKEWDKNTGAIEVWQECLRVLKPGGHILAFSAARTYHRLATNLEDIGFEIRDQIMWIYGSGFPKGQDMGKIIAKREGKRKRKIYFEDAPEEVESAGKTRVQRCVKCHSSTGPVHKKCNDPECIRPWDESADNEWSGWKTGLKPAHEPIVMARKPFKGSTVDNVLKHGTGAINIDDTRVEFSNDDNPDAVWVGGTKWTDSIDQGDVKRGGNDNTSMYSSQLGRYPSNVIGEIEGEEQKYFYQPELTEEEVHNPIVMARKPFKGSTVDNVLKHGTGAINIDDTRVGNHIWEYTPEGYSKESGKSLQFGKGREGIEVAFKEERVGRYPANVIMSEEEGKEEYKKYYYCPKVSRKERNIGCDDLKEKHIDKDKDDQTSKYGKYYCNDCGKQIVDHVDHSKCDSSKGKEWRQTLHLANNHPTVKPVALMKYLVTLVTPKGGKVLDPFNGSGSTGMAVKGFGGEYVGIDLNPDYIEIAKRRITAWSSGE